MIEHRAPVGLRLFAHTLRCGQEILRVVRAKLVHLLAREHAAREEALFEALQAVDLFADEVRARRRRCQKTRTCLSKYAGALLPVRRIEC